MLALRKASGLRKHKTAYGRFVFAYCGGGIGHELRMNCSEHSQFVSHSRPRLGIARGLSIYLRPAIPDAECAGTLLPRPTEVQQKLRTGGVFAVLVAGAGIAPAPGGYEPPDLLLVYPAIRKSIGARSDFATLNLSEFVEDVLVASDGAMGGMLGNLESGTLVRYLIPDLMSLPRIIE